MAGKLKLTVACGDYELVRALKEGAVEADGLDLVMLTGMGPRERHWRMARRAEFDVCEANVGAYFMERDQGAPLTAIPVFLHRRFRHGFLFVNAAAGIRAPKDLIGKKVGGTNFQPASNIWMRGLPRLFRAGDQRIVRLFPNYKDIELAYFRKTGIFPIMHVTTIKQEIVSKFPWVPTNLVKAFEEAKAIAYRRIANPRVVPLAWVRTMQEEQEELLGRDPWAYGLTAANRKNLETVLRYTFEQGMISRMVPLDALFADTDLGDAGGSDGI